MFSRAITSGDNLFVDFLLPLGLNRVGIKALVNLNKSSLFTIKHLNLMSKLQISR